VRIAHATDFHLSVETPTPHNVDTWSAFDWSVGAAEEADADVLLVGGDLCFRVGEEGVYRRVADRLERFPGEWFVVPGNHDDRALFGPALGRRYAQRPDYRWLDRRVFVGGLPIVLVDSADGTLADEQIAWLDWTLADHERAVGEGRAPAILPIVVHHPIITGIHRYMDGAYRLTNAERVQEVLGKGRRTTPLVLAGHYHCAAETHAPDGVGRIEQLVTPSLFVNINPEAHEFVQSGEPHAIRIVDLDDAGGAFRSWLVPRSTHIEGLVS